MIELRDAAIRPLCPTCGEVMQVQGMHDNKETVLVSCVMLACSTKGTLYVVEVPVLKAEIFNG